MVREKGQKQGGVVGSLPVKLSGLWPGQCVRTPEGREAQIVQITETVILIRFTPGEELGWYKQGRLTPVISGSEPDPEEVR